MGGPSGAAPDAGARATDPGTWRVRRHADAGSFLEEAEAWLLLSEAENNLVLGLAYRLRKSTAGFEAPIYLATVEAAEATVSGCAFRTPPFKLGLTRVPLPAIAPLVEDIAQVYENLPAVLGPEPEAKAFATAWGRQRNLTPTLGMRQRIYQLEAVRWREVRAPGGMRQAAAGDLDLVTAWIEAFTRESGVTGGPARRRADEGIRAGALVLWIDAGEPVAMAGVAAGTPNGARIGYVFTPPARRGQGYATALTAHLSQRLLDRGKRFCFLYTDLSNPTSNEIYQRIGYRPISDVVDYVWKGPQ